MSNKALTKIIDDMLSTLQMLKQEHLIELEQVLLGADKAMQAKLNDVEYLLFYTRQKRGGKQQ